MSTLTAPDPPTTCGKKRASHSPDSGVLPRLAGLAGLFLVELLLLSVWLDNETLLARGGDAGFVGQWGAWLVRGAVCFGVLLLTFAYLKNKTRIAQSSHTNAVSGALLTLHVATMAFFAVLCWALYGNHLGVLPSTVCVWLWLLAGLAGIASAALALVPWSLWRILLAGTGPLAAITLALTAAACVAGNYIRLLWLPASHLTFVLARSLISMAVAKVISDPATLTLGTPRFAVQIAPACSGFEGIGLMLAFSICWLWFFRRDCRLPHALLLIPAGVTAIFLLNAVRIAALILLGNAGAPDLALGGFHSQAGWIAFNGAALGICLAAPRLQWLRRDRDTEKPFTREANENPATPYLLPLIVLMATGMIATAASSSFGWLYPVRLAAVAIVLWRLRSRYASMNWRFGWYGPAMGLIVFLLWIACDAHQTVPHTEPMPQALAASSTGIRIAWIALRFVAAATTVPIAEELAFRGFLLRRIVSARFDALPAAAFTWPALALSSVAFGLLHGRLWLPGTLAGLLYAAALIRRGRIGEAVAAHATTNALLGCYILIFHRWHLWM